MNLEYQYLLDISTAISSFVVIAIFLFLFESRYPKKKYMASLVPFMILWFGVNLGILFFLGLEVQGQLSLITATIPSLLYFWIVAKDRGGRFFFTFCLVDTVMIWVMSITGIVDIFIGNTGFWTFVLRIISFPIMLVLAWRWARKPYLRLLNTVARGWWLFAAMTGLFYVAMTIMIGIPTNLRLRPEDIPATVLVMVLLPLVYATIFRVLGQQQELFDTQERQRTLEVQAAMVEQRADEFRRMEDKIRIERHDLRHRFQAVYTMLQNGQSQEAMEYINDAQDILHEADVEHYCTHPVLDAILVAYFQRAKEMGIQVETELAIPDNLPVPAAELSTVFANALENMIHAVQTLPAEERKIVCKCIHTPRLMIEFSNPCAEEVQIDADGLPIAKGMGHGIGTRSIAAFAEKNRAVYSFRMEDGWFKLQLAL
ncbi:MAG: GHKL domain-containing protein [Oscillospiraceae bacterium]|nr:GHKL domain-containing protein [Oscillospiraceae bacterium]